MWITREWCRPTICDKQALMSEDDVFMTKDLIREECSKCLHNNLCLQVIDLLNNKHPNEAEQLIDWMWKLWND